MKRLDIPGGIYPDASTNGSFVCPVPHLGQVQTHLGNFDYPAGEDRSPGLMFTRLTDVSTFKFAAKSHSGAFIHLWQHGGWTIDERDSYGTQGHIWDDGGVLHVGYVTPDGSYAEVRQTDGEQRGAVAEWVDDAEPIDTVTVSGRQWDIVESPESGKQGLVATVNGTTVVVTGKAELNELQELAGSLM